MTNFIATLIASHIPLSNDHFKAIGFENLRWLKPNMAAQSSIGSMPSMIKIKKIRGLLAHDKIDILFTPENQNPIKLFLADMDSTIVTSETLDELADKAGIKDKIAAITTRAMNGELDFHTALIERVGLLKSLPLTALQETLHETILCDGALELVTHLKTSGAKCVLVSGGFTYFTNAIATQCGFQHHHGNILNHDGKTLDGTVAMPILDKNSKLEFLKSYANDLGIGLESTMAIGDGANDLPMLQAAGIGIGYRPKPLVEDTIPNVLKYASLSDLIYIL